MNKLVIQTQYLENYGDRSDPYMKFKGGNTYVYKTSEDLDQNQIATIVAQFKPSLMDLESSNGGCEEFILSAKVVPLSEKVCEDWEFEIEFSFDTSTLYPTVNFIKIVDNREDGWMRKEILEQTETWSFVPGQGNGSRANYNSELLMNDGDIINQKELGAWLEVNAPVESEIARDIQF